jgi:EpsI family protein
MRKVSLYVMTVGMLSAALALGTWSQHRPVPSLNRPLQQIPTQLGRWRVVQEQQLMSSVEQKLKASSYISRTYSDGQTNLDLFIAYYAAQHAGESMHSPKHCLPGAGWSISQHEVLDIPLKGVATAVNRYDIQKGPDHAVTLYWYQSKNRILASEYSAKVMLGYDALMNGNTSGSIVRILCPNDPNAARQAKSFAELVIPEVQLCFGAQ